MLVLSVIHCFHLEGLLKGSARILMMVMMIPWYAVAVVQVATARMTATVMFDEPGHWQRSSGSL